MCVGRGGGGGGGGGRKVRIQKKERGKVYVALLFDIF